MWFMDPLGLSGPCPLWSSRRLCVGPLLCINYTSVLATLLASHAVLAQLYADDVHAYQQFLFTGAAATVRAMNIAMKALGTWTSSNRLRLNSLKTKFSWLGTRQQLAKLDVATLAAECQHFIFSAVVRDIL